jgi:hypothetical protein
VFTASVRDPRISCCLAQDFAYLSQIFGGGDLETGTFAALEHSEQSPFDFIPGVINSPFCLIGTDGVLLIGSAFVADARSGLVLLTRPR